MTPGLWVITNWIGIPRLYQLLKKTTVPVVNGNFSLLPPYVMKFPAYEIYKIKGAKIAVIGMQASFLKHWFIGEDFEGYSVQKVVEVLPEILEEIRNENVDMIILAMHHGFKYSDARGVNEVTDVAKFFPEIDLILGGHTHQNVPGRSVYGTFILRQDTTQVTFGEVKAKINLKDKRVESLKSRLINVEKEFVPDQGANELYKKWQPVIEHYSEELIVELTEPISAKGYPGLGCQTSSLIAEAMIEASNADFALHGSFQVSL